MYTHTHTQRHEVILCISQNRLGYAIITNTPRSLGLQITRDLFLAHASCLSPVSLIPDSRPEHSLEHPTVAEGKKTLLITTEQLNALSQFLHTIYGPTQTKEPRNVILLYAQKGELEYLTETANDYQILSTLCSNLFYQVTFLSGS